MICGGLLGLLLPYEPRGRSSIWFGWWVVHPEMGCGVLCSFKIETRSWGWMCIWFFFSVQCTSDWNYNQWVVEAEPDILDYNGTTGSVTASLRRYSNLPWILSVGPPVTSIFLAYEKAVIPFGIQVLRSTFRYQGFRFHTWIVFWPAYPPESWFW